MISIMQESPHFSAVSSSHFYGKKDPLLISSASHPTQLPYIAALQRIQQRHLVQAEKELFQVFTRQDTAFHAFDELDSSLQSRSKVYTYEALEAGKRHFLLAENDVFLDRYFQIPLHNRHVYEIIRNTFPCRLYFDLEFNQTSNPGVDGNQLTRQWIEIVVWKLKDLYDITCEYEQVLVLDSSTEEKFSKHLIFQLWQDSAKSREFLFADNHEMSLLVRAVLLDITAPFQPICDTADSSSPFLHEDCICTIDGIIRAPYPEYRCLWLQVPKSISSDTSVASATSNSAVIEAPASSNRKQLFVDTGVYTKNRAFRMYGSCKHGKQKMLGLTSYDEAHYYRYSSCVSSGIKTSQLASAKRKDIMTKSYIIPIDLLVDYQQVTPLKSQTITSGLETSSSSTQHTESTPDSATSVQTRSLHEYKTFDSFISALNRQKYTLLPRFQDLVSKSCLFRDVDLSEIGNKRRFDEINVNDSGLTTADLSYQRCRVAQYALFPTHHVFVDSNSQISSFFMAPSQPTPKSVSSASTHLHPSSWKQQLVLQSRTARQPTPFSGIDQFVTWYYAQTKGTVSQGYIGSWMIYKYFNKGGFPVYKIRYQIHGNKYCEHVQRPHRSNGIYVECNLMSRVARQRCWDIDCQHFSFAEIPLPEKCLPFNPEEVISMLDTPEKESQNRV